MNITRRAVKAFSLHHLFYEIFKYLPINLFVINLVVSCSLKNHAKKSVLKILPESLENTCESVNFYQT